MDSEPISHSYLNKRHRELRQKFHHLARNNQDSASMKAALLRTGRANSWISYATEGEPERYEVAFVFLWTAFNALYGTPELSGYARPSEPTLITKYLHQIVSLDTDGRTERVLATQRRHVDDMLFNPFVSDRFWSRYRSRGHYDEAWLLEDVRKNWDGQTTAKRIEFLVIKRIYMLRNQVFHGSTTSTASGTTGRPQVVQGSTIMHHLVPLFSLLTMENSEHGWEPPYFPGNPLKYDGSWKEEIEGVGWREI